MKNKSLGKNAIYNIAYSILNIIFPLISTAYVSRVLMADGVGRISAVNNNVSYFLILATLGIPAYGLREISKNRESKDKRSKLFCELMILNILLTIATYIIFNIIIHSFDYFRTEITLYRIFGFILLLNIFNIEWFFKGMEEYGYIAIRSSVIKVISIVLLFVFVKNKEDIYAYGIIMVLATTGNFILNVFNLHRFVKISIKNIDIRYHLRPLLYLALCSISTELYAKMDITMLDTMKDSSIVGYYTNSQKIVNLIVTTLIAITAVFLPRLSFLFDKNKNEFNRILNCGFTMMVILSFPVCAGVMVISEPLVLSFLGQGFESASTTVRILSLMIPLKCIGDLICYQIMLCARKENILMISYFVTMFVNLINNFILIPWLAAEGASIASVISEILAFGFVLFFARRYYVLKNIKVFLIKTLFSTIMMVCAIIPFSVLNISCYEKLIIQIGVGMIVYFVASFITRNEAMFMFIGILKKKTGR